MPAIQIQKVMHDSKMATFIKTVLDNMPSGWLSITTHRLDIYDEPRAKIQFLEEFEALYQAKTPEEALLDQLPTAYDYIRLGHPLSCILEWTIAKANRLHANQVISFSSETMPILAILRTNHLANKASKLFYYGELPASFDADTIRSVYGYQFELEQVTDNTTLAHLNSPTVDCSRIIIMPEADYLNLDLVQQVDFYVTTQSGLGSVLLVNGDQNKSYISDIQHVRRRETIAMTPANCLVALQQIAQSTEARQPVDPTAHKSFVQEQINSITGTTTHPIIGSSGLSVQYAIMMGLVEDALVNYPGKEIKFVVPPNCYGGTNDQARRVAACLNNVEIVDLPVDGDNDMVQSVEQVLETIAKADAIPYIIAEIPTNPRVEVPDLEKLKAALGKPRQTLGGADAIAPVFILDQTFCPNVLFLGEGKMLSTVKTISYASGSKFPSGGLCTAGYCVSNTMASSMMDAIARHLTLCDNEATALQYEILANQLPSMNQRIADAYRNTRVFVNHINAVLPSAKINFVSEELAAEGFTPSVFSLDLPTTGNTAEEREMFKRALNHKLINMMIKAIPQESKYCVSYGQLKGCYWTIPATSTQGTTKEDDKDYIARVALSANMDIALHKKVFSDFVKSM